MHFSDLDVAVIAVFATAATAAIGLDIKERRQRRFDRKFQEAFGFIPLREAYTGRQERLVLRRLEEAARELAGARSTLRRHVDAPKVDSLEGALFRGMTIDQTKASARRLEDRYEHLRKLARRGGCSWRVLDELHERILDVGSNSAIAAPAS